MKVLYLSEWYPHRRDAMSGLFVRKHAIACVRQGIDVCVLFIMKDTHDDIIIQTTDGVREVYVYHTGNYYKALYKGWQTLKESWGIPDLCQINVITKNAILALWLKFFSNIPFVVVEHWTGYLDSNPQYTKSGTAHKIMTRLTTWLASAVMPVSNELKKAMIDNGLKSRRWQIINNVVDDFFYNRTQHKQASETFNLLHISCFDEPHKNVCGILRAAKEVSLKHYKFRLTLVGTGPDYQQALDCAKALNFPPETLRWTGELQPEQVAEEFDMADAFVLFSNYENAAVVLSESLVAGVPIISTPVGFATEIVTPECGLLVPTHDEKALADAICKMIDNGKMYDKEHIKRQGEQYKFDNVGKELAKIYHEALH
ncbi:MAG: glycosyltransferase family 4 protein [Paludibacteraceae bacterium]|nr:glycosyltransferase family 4 protein [Paludibacteraceae bacterium]